MTQRFGDPDMHAEIERALADFPGRLTVYAKNLATGEELGLDADDEMPTASVIKVPIMAVLYARVAAGEIDLDRRIPIESSDWKGGTGILKELTPGIAPTGRDLCRLMICLSDNIATTIIVRLLGKERINETLAGWGFPRTRAIMSAELGGNIREYARSTPREIGGIMERIANRRLVSESSSTEMLRHLSRQQHLEQIARGIPFSPYIEEFGLTQTVHVYNMIGNYRGMRADAAYVESPNARFVLVTINEGSPDHGFGIDHEGNVLNGRIGKIVFDRWMWQAAV